MLIPHRILLGFQEAVWKEVSSATLQKHLTFWGCIWHKRGLKKLHRRSFLRRQLLLPPLAEGISGQQTSGPGF